MESEDKVKQTLIVRNDLNVRKGKLISQGAHASISFLVDRLAGHGTDYIGTFSEEELLWMTGAFTKICLKVNSEKELLDLHEAAIKAGLTSYLIQDSGLTEFHGVLTYTAVAIGPHYASKIDPLTKDLILL